MRVPALCVWWDWRREFPEATKSFQMEAMTGLAKRKFRSETFIGYFTILGVFLNTHQIMFPSLCIAPSHIYPSISFFDIRSYFDSSPK